MEDGIERQKTKLVEASMRLGMSPEKFRKVLPQFQVDIARLLDVPPDEIEIVSVQKIDKPAGSADTNS